MSGLSFFTMIVSVWSSRKIVFGFGSGLVPRPALSARIVLHDVGIEIERELLEAVGQVPHRAAASPFFGIELHIHIIHAYNGLAS